MYSSESPPDSLAISWSDVQQNENYYVILRPPKGNEWNTMLVILLTLPSKLLWQVFILCTVLLSFTIGLMPMMFPTNYHLMANFLTGYVICDVIYAIDVVLLILNNYWKKLSLRYTTRKTPLIFIISDIISLFPQEVILYAILGKDANWWMVYLRIFTFLRMRRLQFFTENLNKVLKRRLFWFTVQYIAIFYIISHVSVCVWVHMGCEDSITCRRTNDSWVKLLQADTQVINDIYKFYMTSFYSVITFLSNTGIGDIYATDPQEEMCVSVMMIIGAIFVKVTLCGFLACQMINLWYHRTKFIHRLINTKKYLVEIGCSKELTYEVLEYYNILWKYKTGIKDANEFRTIPEPMRMELTYDINYVFLQRTLLFSNQPESFMRSVSMRIKNIFLLPGEKVFHQGVVKGQLIYITRGVLEILSDEDDESPIISFKAGTVLGEISLYLCVPAKATVRAAVYTELQVLDRVDFMKLMLEYGDVSTMFCRMIHERIHTASKAKNVHRTRLVLNFLASGSKEVRPIKLLKIKLTEKKSAMRRKLKGTKSKDDMYISSQSHKERVYFLETYLPLYILSSNVTMVENPKICLKSDCPWILDPNSNFVRQWNTSVLVSQTLQVVLLCYYVFFERHLPETVQILTIFCDIHYFFYFFMRIITAKTVKDKVIKKVKIITDYLMKDVTFYIDVLSLLPFELLLSALDPSMYEQRVKLLLQLNRLLRSYRIMIFFRGQEQKLIPNTMLLKITKFLTYILILLLFTAGLFYIIACWMSICKEGSWYHNQTDKFVGNNPFAVSFYYATSNLLLVGFGNIKSINTVESYGVALAQYVGILIICYLFAELTALVILSGRHERHYKEKVYTLDKHLAKLRIPNLIRKRIAHYFALQWYCDKGTGRSDLLNTAPQHLKTALQNTEMVQSIETAQLFQMLPVDFLVIIAENSKIQMLPPQEVIYYAGDITREMYILQKGHCQIRSSRGEVIRTCDPGAQFGDIEMLFGIPKRYTISTITNCKVIVVEYRAYLQAMSVFPAIYDELKFIMESGDLTTAAENIDKERQYEIRLPKTVSPRKDFKTRVNTFFTESFALTYWNCKKSKGLDNYWEPFIKLGRLRFVGYLLLPLTIHHLGPFFKIWCLMRLVLILFFGIVGPIFAAMPPYMSYLSWVYVVTYISALMELYIFLHGTYHNNDGILITHPKFTARNYLTRSFFLDFVAAFPYKYILFWVLPDTENLDPVVHLPIRRTYYCMSVLTLLIQSHRLFGLLDYFESDIFFKKIIVVKYLKTVIPLLLFINFVAAIMVSIDCSYTFASVRGEDKESEIIQVDPRDGIMYYGYLTCRNSSWLMTSQFNKSTNPLVVFTVSFYWVTSTICLVGIGDIIPAYPITMYIICITVILGVMIIGYIYATIGCEYSHFASEYIMYLKKMRHFRNSMQKENVVPELQNKVMQYYTNLWKRESGLSNQELCQRLNTALAEDTLVFMYEKTLREVPLFENVEKSFIRVIAKHLTEQYFLRGDIIVRQSDVQPNIYIIHSGKVEVLSTFNEMITCMGEGGLFGNISQVTAGFCSVTIVAMRRVDLLVISSERFYAILNDYPKMKNAIQNVLKTAKNYIVPTTILDEEGEIGKGDEKSSFGSAATVDKKSRLRKLIDSRDDDTFSEDSEETVFTRHSSHSRDLDIHICRACLYFLNPRKWFRFSLVPEHPIFTVMVLLVFVAVFCNILIIPYHFVSQDEQMYLLVVTMCMEPIFYLNIFFSLHKSYLSNKGTYVMSCRSIARRYFRSKTRIMVDIVPNIPVEIMCLFASSENRLLVYTSARMYHLLRIMSLIEYFSRTMEEFITNPQMATFVKIVLVTHISVHIFSCVWYMLICPFSACLRGITFGHRTTKFFVYVNSFYYMSSLATATGLGDVYPTNMKEIIVSIISILFFKFMMALFLGEIISMMNVITVTFNQYEYRITCIQQYLKNQDLSEHQMDKLKNYVSLLWDEEKGENMSTLLSKCPYVLRCDIMTAMYGHHLRNCVVFKGINEALLKQMAAGLQRVVFFDGNYILQKGAKNRSIYFIHSGRVAVLTIHVNLMETQHEILKEQEVFGLIQGLAHSVPFAYSYRAMCKTEIIMLCFDLWSDILNHFPEDRELIYMRARDLFLTL